MLFVVVELSESLHCMYVESLLKQASKQQQASNKQAINKQNSLELDYLELSVELKPHILQTYSTS